MVTGRMLTVSFMKDANSRPLSPFLKMSDFGMNAEQLVNMDVQRDLTMCFTQVWLELFQQSVWAET